LRFAKVDGQHPEREKAQGSIRPFVGLNPRRIARDSRKAVPGSRALSRVSRRFSNRWLWTQAATASGAWHAGNACWTFRGEKAPKGEPERRYRSETRPTRQPREQAVERVTKPCGRKVSGDGFARDNRTSVAASAIREKSPRERLTPAGDRLASSAQDPKGWRNSTRGAWADSKPSTCDGRMERPHGRDPEAGNGAVESGKPTGPIPTGRIELWTRP